jgi:hypothetical protein
MGFSDMPQPVTTPYLLPRCPAATLTVPHGRLVYATFCGLVRGVVLQPRRGVRATTILHTTRTPVDISAPLTQTPPR